MKKNNKKGFTLLEVLLSIIIVGMVLVCVIILNNASTEASRVSKFNANVYTQINNLLNEFSVAPDEIIYDARVDYPIYYSEDFSAKIDVPSENVYYIQVEGTRTSRIHANIYEVTLTIHTPSDGEEGCYTLYGYSEFTRVCRMGV